MSMGMAQVHGPKGGPQSDALKVADPTPLLALLRSLDPRNTGVVARSQFERAIRVAAGNALTEDEVQHLADHYATSVERLDVGKEPGGFAVQRSSTEKSADPVPEPVVDYELFVSSAKLGAAFGAPRSDMPYNGFYSRPESPTTPKQSPNSGSKRLSCTASLPLASRLSAASSSSRAAADLHGSSDCMRS